MGDAEFEEDGIIWQGTRQELDAWKQYKRDKAHAFIDRGYSVAWHPDADNHMEIFLPARLRLNEPTVRAGVVFFSKPSKYGIDQGRVSKLHISVVRGTQPIPAILGVRDTVEVIYNFDRGPDINRLAEIPRAKSLYDAIIEVLN